MRLCAETAPKMSRTSLVGVGVVRLCQGFRNLSSLLRSSQQRQHKAKKVVSANYSRRRRSPRRCELSRVQAPRPEREGGARFLIGLTKSLLIKSLTGKKLVYRTRFAQGSPRTRHRKTDRLARSQEIVMPIRTTENGIRPFLQPPITGLKNCDLVPPFPTLFPPYAASWT